MSHAAGVGEPIDLILPAAASASEWSTVDGRIAPVFSEAHPESLDAYDLDQTGQ